MADSSLETDTPTTRGMASGEAREHWRQIVASYQCHMTCEFPDGSAGASVLRRVRTDRNQVLAWHSPRVRYRRSSQHMRRDGIDTYILFFPDTGAVDVSLDSGSATLEPGSGALIATTQPFDVSHTPDARLRAVTIQGRTIRQRLPQSTEFARPVDLVTGLGGVVRDLLDSTLRMADQLSAQHFDAAVDRLVELVCVLVGANTANATDHFRDIEAAIRRHVRENAHNSDLNSTMIAAALGWSVRQAQLALQRSGTTCRDLIREERLLLAHERLVSAAYGRTSITEIAYRSGFTSPGRFSTSFRERFGVTPRELRGTQG